MKTAIMISTRVKADRRRLCKDTMWVAARIGCSDRAVYYWETGKRTPSMGNIIKWATALGYNRIVIEM